ncbi:hypothetical protein PhCBS80983_g02111 [Powellomyces hirtus]|uniref:DUF962 domain-containing protein n=1 Tax=Powellomyces hirtus TaxID=109895 RepID=A0A507E7P0_9FUNG|nr:hypothetical protein PhCBS80983_g02111 [Powellomyces hirtus]
MSTRASEKSAASATTALPKATLSQANDQELPKNHLRAASLNPAWPLLPHRENRLIALSPKFFRRRAHHDVRLQLQGSAASIWPMYVELAKMDAILNRDLTLLNNLKFRPQQNQLVHIVFVPTILWSAQVWLTQTGAITDWSLSYLWPLNLAFILTVMYNVYYIILDPIAGTLYAPVLFGLCHYANVFAAKDQVFGLSPQMAATAIHLSSWIMQFAGHGFAEGRAPALLDNLLQALVLAPFFVWIEVLFRLGYRPQLRNDLQKSVDDAIAVWRKSKGKKAQ